MLSLRQTQRETGSSHSLALSPDACHGLSWELNPGLPCGQQGPSYLSNHLLPPGSALICREFNQEPSWVLWQRTWELRNWGMSQLLAQYLLSPPASNPHFNVNLIKEKYRSTKLERKPTLELLPRSPTYYLVCLPQNPHAFSILWWLRLGPLGEGKGRIYSRRAFIWVLESCTSSLWITQ